MRIRGALLAVFAAAALVGVAAVVVISPLMQLQAEVVAFAALTGYVALAGRRAAALARWPLLVGLVAVTAWIGVELIVYQPVTTHGWVSYQSLRVRTERPFADATSHLGSGLWQAAKALILYGCVAAATIALVPRRRPRLAVRSGALAALVLAYSGWYLWQATAKAHPLLRLADAVAPMLVLALAVLTAGVAVQRGGAAVLVGPGVAVMVLPSLALFGPAAVAGVALPVEYGFYDGALWSTVVDALPTTTTATPLLILPALLTGAYLAGLALVVVGCVHAGRHAERSEPAGGPHLSPQPEVP